MFVYYYFFKGREPKFGRSLVPFIMESGNVENVTDMVPTVCYSQKQRSTLGSTVVDGKMERSMYVLDILLNMHTVTRVCTLSDIFCILLHVLRGMGCTSTTAQQFMRGSGVRTIGVAGEGCTTRMEISMRESG